jgi:hypothetical protein
MEAGEKIETVLITKRLRHEVNYLREDLRLRGNILMTASRNDSPTLIAPAKKLLGRKISSGRG